MPFESASTYLSYEGFRISDPRLSASVEGIDVGRLARRYGGIDTLGGTVDLNEISLAAGPAIVVAVAGRDLRYEGDREIGPVGNPGTLDLRAEWRDGRLLVANARATIHADPWPPDPDAYREPDPAKREESAG